MQPDALFPLTPALSLREREPIGARLGTLTPQWAFSSAANVLPLPRGEGRGEGELVRRTDAAALNVFGPRETEPQFLAALDKNVRAPEKCEMRTSLA